jgi:hypothetical protein
MRQPPISATRGERPPGEVLAAAIYTLDEINARLGLGKKAIRRARQQGLIVKRIGRRAYVRGSDLIEWFDRTAKRVA